MGVLPPIKRFSAEDYPTQTSWINTLLYPLNQLLNTVYANFNNGLTINQNMLAMVKTISITGASPKTSFAWTYSNQGAPIGVTLVQTVQTNGTAVPVTNAVTCDWSYSSGTISINNVTGLNSANTYNCTFIVWGG